MAPCVSWGALFLFVIHVTQNKCLPKRTAVQDTSVRVISFVVHVMPTWLSTLLAGSTGAAADCSRSVCNIAHVQLHSYRLVHFLSDFHREHPQWTSDQRMFWRQQNWRVQKIHLTCRLLLQRDDLTDKKNKQHLELFPYTSFNFSVFKLPVTVSELNPFRQKNPLGLSRWRFIVWKWQLDWFHQIQCST